MKTVKLFWTLLVLVNTLVASGNESSSYKDYLKTIETLRYKYYSAVENEDSLSSYERLLNNNYISIQKSSPALALAFQAGIEAVKSKHAFWPHKKLSHLSKSMEFLEEAIKLEPQNLEIRFMRFSILHYVPGFLGYGDERESDARTIFKLLLKKDYSTLGNDIQKGIFEFMIRSERLTEEETFTLMKNFRISVLSDE